MNKQLDLERFINGKEGFSLGAFSYLSATMHLLHIRFYILPRLYLHHTPK